MKHRLFVVLFLGSCMHSGVPGQAKSADSLLYTVAWGDTLTDIARRFDVKGGYPALAKQNDIAYPDWIGAGDVLQVPATAEAKRVLGTWPASTPLTSSLEEGAVERLASPRRAQVDGCYEAACVRIDNGRDLCACDGGEAADRFLLTRPGSERLVWPASLPSEPRRDSWSTEGGVEDFELSRADIDADGDTELIVAFRRDLDDLARSTWDVAIIEDPTQEAPPVRLQIGNYGRGTLTPSGKGFDVLATNWESYQPEGTWSARWHLVGRRLAYNDGVLTPRDSPILSRRLYWSFVPTSLEVGPLPVGSPTRDFVPQVTAELDSEPLVRHERLHTARAKILATEDSDGAGPVLVVATGASSVRLKAAPDRSGDETSYQRLGDAKSSRLFPLGYAPSADSLVGRSVLDVTYRTSDWRTERVLWIQ
ncbi:MAG: LysM peptidoglycan-binding domain-containing protein [Proteobacteria bacterium]|nr:LysM peptidoglycan-binding domain-containing protein [Pseudomonadota bacterium]